MTSLTLNYSLVWFFFSQCFLNHLVLQYRERLWKEKKNQWHKVLKMPHHPCCIKVVYWTMATTVLCTKTLVMIEEKGFITSQVSSSRVQGSTVVGKVGWIVTWSCLILNLCQFNEGMRHTRRTHTNHTEWKYTKDAAAFFILFIFFFFETDVCDVKKVMIGSVTPQQPGPFVQMCPYTLFQDSRRQ